MNRISHVPTMKLLASQFRLFSLNLNLPIAKGVVRMALIAQFNFFFLILTCDDQFVHCYCLCQRVGT
jgi:hypothetical protein